MKRFESPEGDRISFYRTEVNGKELWCLYWYGCARTYPVGPVPYSCWWGRVATQVACILADDIHGKHYVFFSKPRAWRAMKCIEKSLRVEALNHMDDEYSLLAAKWGWR